MIRDLKILNQNTVGMIDCYSVSQFTTQSMLFQSTPEEQIHFSGETYFKWVFFSNPDIHSKSENIKILFRINQSGT